MPSKIKLALKCLEKNITTKNDHFKCLQEKFSRLKIENTNLKVENDKLKQIITKNTLNKELSLEQEIIHPKYDENDLDISLEQLKQIANRK